MDVAVFEKSPSGRLVRIGRGEEAYAAFVPAPLPPRLHFEAGLVAALSSADRSLGELAGLGRTMPNPHPLIGPFIRREAVSSSRIEGTQTDISDLYAFEAGQLSLAGFKPAPPPADAQEVLNYVRALEHGLTQVPDAPVTLRLMRDLHACLMAGVRGERARPGEFRQRQNWIDGADVRAATFVPPTVVEMQACLSALEHYMNEDDGSPPLVRLALIHYQFETIHPFLDGNGRIGRLLVSLLLVAWGLLPSPLLYLSTYLERHRRRYCDLLLAVSQRGAWHEWLVFFLEGVAAQSTDAVARAKSLQDLQTRWRQALSKARSAGSLLRLMESLFVSPVLTVSQAQQRLDVSYPSAQKAVARLVEEGVLRPANDASYGRVYLAPDIIHTVTR